MLWKTSPRRIQAWNSVAAPWARMVANISKASSV
jgi:hypothetical protein